MSAIENVQAALQHRAQVEEFLRKHRIGLLTLLFTDIEDSTGLKQALGDAVAVPLLQSHHALVRGVLSGFTEAEAISTEGDSFFIVFARPSDAVKFALLMQASLRSLSAGGSRSVLDRIGIHVGEVFITYKKPDSQQMDLFGLQVDTASRVMSLAQPGQILMSRFAFDNAKQMLRGQHIAGLGEIAWLKQGSYVFKGIEDPVEICEVGEKAHAPLTKPRDCEKARRHISAASLSDRQAVPDPEPAVTAARAQSRLEMERAEDCFASDQAPTAVAYLARLLKRDAMNRAAAERLISALLYGKLANDEAQSLSPGAQWAAYDGTTRVLDAQKSQALTEPLRHGHAVENAVLSSNGQRLLTTAGDYGKEVWEARVWDAHSNHPVTPLLRYRGRLLHAAFNPDGDPIIIAHLESCMQVWFVNTGQLVTELRMARCSSAAFSPDCQRVIMIYYNNDTAQVLDLRTGEAVTVPLRHDAEIYTAAFSPDGLRAVTASADGTARVWDARTGQPVTAALRHRDAVYHAAFSPDGRRVVTASDDRTARIWNASTGQKVMELLGHRGALVRAAFSPDGLRVVTASVDGTARVWDSRTGQAVTDPLRHERSVEETGEMLHAAFSHDGQRVMTVSENSVRVWDACTGLPVTELLENDSSPVAFSPAAFSPDGQRVVTTSQAGTARLWDTPTAPVPVPSWFAEFAEKLVGQRVNANGDSETFDSSEFFKVKQYLTHGESSDFYMCLAKWLVADRCTRAISPFPP